jgi:hypothetical protein
MPIHLIEENSGKLLVVHVSEKIASEDYKHFVSKFERLVTQQGKLDVIFDVTHFRDWDAVAFCDNIVFDLKHFSDIERLAILGGHKWQEAMATFFKSFTQATIRYFDHTDAAKARNWLSHEIRYLPEEMGAL